VDRETGRPPLRGRSAAALRRPAASAVRDLVVARPRSAAGRRTARCGPPPLL